jgi:MFS family permease
MAASRTTAPGALQEASVSWLPLIVVCLAQMTVIVNPAVTSTAIGAIVADFDTPATTIQNALVLYALFSAALMPVGSRLAGIIGPLGSFRLGLAIFSAGILIVALAPAANVLLLGELVAGIGAAALVPALVGLIAANYQGKQQAAAVGMLGAAAGIGGSIGLLGGGALVGVIGWRAPYLVLLVIAAVVLGLTTLMRPTPRAAVPLAFDTVGALLSIAGLLCLVIGMGLVGSWGLLIATPAAPFSFYGASPAGGLVLIGLLLIQGFFVWQRRRVAQGEAPLISPLVTDSALERSTLLLIIIGGFGAAGVSFLIPLYTQLVLGYSVLATALVLMPLAIGTFAGALLAAPMAARLTPRRLVVGALVLKVLALLLIAITLSNAWSSVLLAFALVLLGLNNGMISATLSTVIVSASAPELGADVGALRGTAINLGNAVGTALVGAVLIGGLTGAAVQLARETPEVAQVTANFSALDRVQFVSNEQLARYLDTQVALTPEQRAAIFELNTAARLDALRVAMLFIAGITVLGLVLCKNLPGAAPATLRAAAPRPGGA